MFGHLAIENKMVRDNLSVAVEMLTQERKRYAHHVYDTRDVSRRAAWITNIFNVKASGYGNVGIGLMPRCSGDQR